MAAVVSALIYPTHFLHLGPFDLKLFQIPEIDLQNKWVILVIVQLVMFGMGTKMGFRDFAGVAKMPYPVFIGVGLQFLIMPLMGYALAKFFAFPPEIAAGVVLIGSCSSGLASNVMCYLAGANLALSITLTAVATLLAPLATTFWMQRLAGEFVEIDSLAMLGQIVKIVLVPIGAALLQDYLKHATLPMRKIVVATGMICGVVCILLVINSWLIKDAYVLPLSPAALEALVIFSGAVTFALAYHFIASRLPWIDRNMHVISMFGIVFFTAVTTAAGRDNLLVAGMALFLAAVIHNFSGYTLGYLMSRLAGLDKKSAITVGFEVGMQNGGMASGLAGLMGKLGTVGLAAAVFSPWMNISGSLLANQIRRHNESKASNSD
ncbi:bile acid:sodium symporter family protein [Bythopirellula goksoeyrii]|uniref:bile acid:sodium symporter family protein n=1 Tax=Bythopirellula goksoeyrii TaxID=1400387 RepID=UPI001AEF3C64|nr:bile acid:sodium symporter family protein [Bythopirellula goksoeyrii]